MCDDVDAGLLQRLVRHAEFATAEQPVIAIEWEDSFGCPAGWEFEDEVEPKTTTIKTIGFLIRETDDFLFVAPHISTASDRRQIAGHMAVPKRQIVRSKVVTSFSCQDAESGPMPQTTSQPLRTSDH